MASVLGGREGPSTDTPALRARSLPKTIIWQCENLCAQEYKRTWNRMHILWASLMDGIANHRQRHPNSVLIVYIPARTPLDAVPSEDDDQQSRNQGTYEYLQHRRCMAPQQQVCKYLTLATDYPLAAEDVNGMAAWWFLRRFRDHILVLEAPDHVPLRGAVELYVPRTDDRHGRHGGLSLTQCHLPGWLNGFQRLILVVLVEDIGDSDDTFATRVYNFVNTVHIRVPPLADARPPQKRILRLVFSETVVDDTATAGRIQSAKDGVGSLVWTVQSGERRLAVTNPCLNTLMLRRLHPLCRG